MMSTKRRSARERNVPSKYFKESSSEDEGDDEKTKAAKLKLKELMNEDSDQESDFEQQMKKEEEMSSSESDISDDENMSSRAKGDKSLCLSESDSSDSEDPKASNRKRVSNVQYSFITKLPAKESQDGEEVDANNLKLLALAGNLKKNQTVWEETGTEGPEPKPVKGSNKARSKSKATKKRKSDDCFETVKKPKPQTSSAGANQDSVSKLLAMGEGLDVDENDLDDDEDVKAPILPKSAVEVTVPVPEHLRRKKKREKKEFDVEAFLKRELSRARRELLIVQHKAGVVFQLAHLLHLQTSLASQTLQSLALSLLPPSHTATPATLTLTQLGQMVAWLRETFPVSRHQLDGPTRAVREGLESALSTLLVMKDSDLVMIFILMCRALGYNARLVINLVISTKQDVGDEASQEPKGKQGKKALKESPSSESEEEVPKKKSKKVKEEETEKPKLSSKLAAAAKARKSKRLAPSVTEEAIVSDIKKKSEEVKKEEKKDKKSSKKKTEEVKKEEKKDKKSSKKKSEDVKKEEKVKKSSKKKGESSKSSGFFPETDKKSKAKTGELRYWAEVYLSRERRWVPVDLMTGKVNNAADIEAKAGKAMLYVFGVNNQGRVKDVTRRYASNYLTQTRKARTEESWLTETLLPWLDRDNSREDEELTRKSEEAPLPTNVGAFKGHPLYVLQRHLLKFEAIYPPDAPTLGFIRGEGVYARECVHTLQGRTSWLKEGRVVRLGEEPYKVVKARPKWDRMTGAKTSDEPLEVFGHWQTERYIPPVAVDGKVPRNEYGNVELFKPWMLPGGCVHIPINGMQR